MFKRNEMTPWIRVVQPYTGGGKGFYFVPEIGEEVMIDFEGGNAERPFVLGAHYNGEAKSGYHNADNRVKAIHTKSGHKLIFTEDEGELFLAVHPYLKGDDDMPTIVFINDMLIDNWNTMEGNEWTIEKIEEKDTLLTYFVKIEDGEDSIHSLCLSYNAKKGLMYNIRKDTTFILIDSLYINKIKKIATKTEFSDD